jgi:hypothetical protein
MDRAVGSFAARRCVHTYDWIENLLGLNMHSADTVLPELRHPEVGETIGCGANRMRLERVEPERVLAWRSQDGNWVWTLVLNHINETTRLISRNRFRLPRLELTASTWCDAACLCADGAQASARDQATRRSLGGSRAGCPTASPRSTSR